MAGQDLTLKIKTEYDGKGSEAAAKAVDGLAKSADKAGRAQASAGKQAQQLGQSTGRAAEMVGSLTGAMGQAGPAAARLGAGLRVIKALAEGSAGGLMGIATVLVGAGVSAWAAYQRKVEQSRKELQDFVQEMTDRKIAEGARQIDAIASGFSRVEKAISSARAAQSELAAAWDDLNRAGQEVTQMELDRREKAVLARIPPGDTAAAAAVRAKYTGLRESAALGARAGSAIRAEQAAQDDLAAASGRRANIEKTLGLSMSARDQRAGQLARAVELSKRPDIDDGERARLAQETTDLTAQLATLEKQVGELTDALSAARTTERAAGIRAQAAGLRATQGIGAAEALAQQNISDADLSATRTAWAQRLSESAEAQAARQAQAGAGLSRADAQRGVLSAEANLRNARNSRGGGEDVGALKKELDAAKAARDEANRAFLDFARTSKDKDKQLAEALRNLPNN